MPKRKTSDKNFSDLQSEINLETFRASVKSNFGDFPDPRNTSQCLYPAWYLFLLILSGYLAGCNSIADIAHFAQLRSAWFGQLSGLSVKAPSYDTIWWFLVRVDPRAFKTLIIRWLKDAPQNLKDQLLVVDGKRLRGISDNEHITHIVELFAAENRLVIAQEKVPDKRGEASALPALLDMVDVKGAIVSMDALYANIDALNQVLNRQADYIVGIKGNQATLQAEMQNFFEQARAVDYDGIEGISHIETCEQGHGRREKRHVCVVNELGWLPQQEEWQLRSLIEVRAERAIGEKVALETRYYGSSREANAETFSKLIRDHWSIENSLHYVMDVIFEEDFSLSDTGHSAENMALIRRLSLNIVNTQDPGRGMSDARRGAAYEPDYLRGLLAKVFVK